MDAERERRDIIVGPGHCQTAHETLSSLDGFIAAPAEDALGELLGGERSGFADLADYLQGAGIGQRRPKERSCRASFRQGRRNLPGGGLEIRVEGGADSGESRRVKGPTARHRWKPALLATYDRK